MELNNPFLEFQDPFKEYNEALKKLQSENPRALTVGKLCYEIFLKDEFGIELWDILKEDVLMKNFVDPTHNAAAQAAIYYEGYKQAYRVLYLQALAHKKRIESHDGRG